MAQGVTVQQLKMQVSGVATGISGMSVLEGDMGKFAATITSGVDQANADFSKLSVRADETSKGVQANFVKMSGSMGDFQAATTSSMGKVQADYSKLSAKSEETGRRVKVAHQGMKESNTATGQSFAALSSGVGKAMTDVSVNSDRAAVTVDRTMTRMGRKTSETSKIMREALRLVSPAMADLGYAASRMTNEWDHDQNKMQAKSTETTRVIKANARAQAEAMGAAGGGGMGGGGIGGAAGAAAGGGFFRSRGMHQATGAGMVVGAGALGLGYETAKAAVGWDTLTRRIQANTSMSNRELAYMKAATIDWSTKTGAAADDVAMAYQRAANSGLHYGRAMAFVREATKSALPTGGSVQDTTVAMLAARAAFGFAPTARNARMIVNTQHMAASLGDMTLPQLAQAYPQLGIVASHFGGGVRGYQQSLGALAALTRTHMPLDEAVTQLKDLYLHIAAPSAKAETAIARIYNQTQGRVDLRRDFTSEGLKQRGITGVLQDIRGAHLTGTELYHLIPNIRGFVGALSLTGQQHGSLMQIMPQLQHANQTDITQRAWGNYAHTTAAQWKLMKAEANSAEIAIGSGLLPAINSVLKGIVPMAGAFAAFARANPALISTVVKLGIAIGGIALALRGVAMAQTAFTTLMSINPVILGIIAAGVLIYVAYNHWTGFRHVVNALAKDLMGFAGWIGSTLIPGLGKFVSFLGGMVSWVQHNWQTALFMALTGPFGLTLVLVQHFFPNFARTMTTGLRNALQLVWSFSTNVWTAFKNLISGVTSWIGTNWKLLLLGALNPPLLMAILIFKALPASWKAHALSAIKGFASGITSGAGHLKDALVHAVTSALTAAMSWIKKHNPFNNFHLPNPFSGWSMPSFGLGGGGGFQGSSSPTGIGTAFLGSNSKSYVNSGQEPGNAAMFRGNNIKYSGALLDWDYGAAGGSQVKLPGGSNAVYKYLGQYSLPGMGTAEFFATPNGGVFAVNHLSKSLGNNLKGQTMMGGTTIGLSGEPTSSAYNGGQPNGTPDWHLCLVTDANGRQYLMRVAGTDLSKVGSYNPNALATTGGSWTSKVSPYSAAINAAAARYHIPAAVIASQIFQESSGNPRATTRGADGLDIGLMQFGPSEARQAHGKYTYNPAQNIMTGVGFLSYLLHGPAHGDLRLALAMYNAGQGNPGAGSGYAKSILSRVQTGQSSGGGGYVGGGGGFQPIGYDSKTQSFTVAPRPTQPGTVYTDPVSGKRSIFVGPDARYKKGHWETVAASKAAHPHPGEVNYDSVTHKYSVFEGPSARYPKGHWVAMPTPAVKVGTSYTNPATHATYVAEAPDAMHKSVWWARVPGAGVKPGTHYTNPATGTVYVAEKPDAMHKSVWWAAQRETAKVGTRYTDPNTGTTYVMEGPNPIHPRPHWVAIRASSKNAALQDTIRGDVSAEGLFKWQIGTFGKTPYLSDMRTQGAYLQTVKNYNQMRRDIADLHAKEAYNRTGNLTQYKKTTAYQQWLMEHRDWLAWYKLTHEGQSPGSEGHVVGMRFMGHVAGATKVPYPGHASGHPANAASRAAHHAAKTAHHPKQTHPGHVPPHHPASHPHPHGPVGGSHPHGHGGPQIHAKQAVEHAKTANGYLSQLVAEMKQLNQNLTRAAHGNSAHAQGQKQTNNRHIGLPSNPHPVH